MKEYKLLDNAEKKERWKEIFKVFLKLGTVAFGGPAAHVSMMEEEIVNKRKWLSREKFMDLYGATNLIPGPNSTELAIHLSFERGGLLGLFIGGVSFILPAMLIVLSLAYTYMVYGALPELTGMLSGIKPVIISIVLLALYRLGKNLLKNKLSIAVFTFAFTLTFLGLGEIRVLIFTALVLFIYKKYKTRAFSFNPFGTLLLFSLGAKEFTKMTSLSVFSIFLKIGSVLYGSGYVLLAFLESEFVHKYQVITSSQLIDAVAVGQFTPGPVFTTATFIGYLIKGFPGAIAATVGIFLPSFLLVWLLNPLIPKMRNSKVFSVLLDGVNLASLALMASVLIKLGNSSITNFYTFVIFIISFIALLKTKINSAFFILAGGVIGYFLF